MGRNRRGALGRVPLADWFWLVTALRGPRGRPCGRPLFAAGPNAIPRALRPPAETHMKQRDAAELVADKKPAYITLKAGSEGAHFMLIEMKQEK